MYLSLTCGLPHPSFTFSSSPFPLLEALVSMVGLWELPVLQVGCWMQWRQSCVTCKSWPGEMRSGEGPLAFQTEQKYYCTLCPTSLVPFHGEQRPLQASVHFWTALERSCLITRSQTELLECNSWWWNWVGRVRGEACWAKVLLSENKKKRVPGMTVLWAGCWNQTD